MRTRSRNNVVSLPPQIVRTLETTNPPRGVSAIHGVTCTDTAVIDASSSSEFSGYASKVGVVETITDEVGYGAYNEVIHTREIWDVPLSPASWRGWSDEYQGNTCTSETVGLLSAGVGNAAYGRGSVNWGSSATNDEQLAVSQLNFGLETTPTNVPQLLGELSELRSSLKGIGGDRFRPQLGKDHPLWDQPSLTARELRRWHRRLEGQMRAASNKPLRHQSFGDLMRAAIQGDLIRKFAWEPFVADMDNLVKSLKMVRAALDKLEGRKKATLTTYGTVNTDALGAFDAFTDSNVYRHAWTSNRSGTRRTTAYVRFTRDLGNLPAPPTWLVAADMLGFDDPLRAAWELTPWSFVVDYFVDVGNWLRQFNGQIIDLPYTVVASGVSVKQTTTCEATVTFDTGSTAWKYSRLAEGSVSGRVTDVLYSRKRGLPLITMPVPRLTLPSFNQGFTMLELFLQGFRPGG